MSPKGHRRGRIGGRHVRHRLPASAESSRAGVLAAGADSGQASTTKAPQPRQDGRQRCDEFFRTMVGRAARRSTSYADVLCGRRRKETGGEDLGPLPPVSRLAHLGALQIYGLGSLWRRAEYQRTASCSLRQTTSLQLSSSAVAWDEHILGAAFSGEMKAKALGGIEKLFTKADRHGDEFLMRTIVRTGCQGARE